MISRRTFVSGLASTGLVGSVVGRDSSLNASADCVRYSTDVPVYGNYDIAVFGAGPAGIAAKVDSGLRKGVTQIPYGSLVPRDLDNVIVGGRCIGEETYVIGCTRMMPTCFATGQVAGTAAALAVEDAVEDVGAVSYAKLRKVLTSQGHILA